MCKALVNTVEQDSAMELWHRRLGHISEKGLQALAKRNLLPAWKGTHLSPCVHCLAGKQTRAPFVKRASCRKSDV